jgi:hypothetical protein
VAKVSVIVPKEVEPRHHGQGKGGGRGHQINKDEDIEDKIIELISELER